MGKIENFKDKVNTVGFSQMPENICKSGRPKKIYTVLSEQGYSKDDIRTAFGELGWYTLKQLEVVHSDNKKPLIVRIIANQFIIAFEKGDFLKVKEIIEYVVGKPHQSVDYSSKDGSMTPQRIGRVKVHRVNSFVNNKK